MSGITGKVANTILTRLARAEVDAAASLFASCAELSAQPEVAAKYFEANCENARAAAHNSGRRRFLLEHGLTVLSEVLGILSVDP